MGQPRTVIVPVKDSAKVVEAVQMVKDTEGAEIVAVVHPDPVGLVLTQSVQLGGLDADIQGWFRVRFVRRPKTNNKDSNLGHEVHGAHHIEDRPTPHPVHQMAPDSRGASGGSIHAVLRTQ